MSTSVMYSDTLLAASVIRSTSLRCVTVLATLCHHFNRVDHGFRNRAPIRPLSALVLAASSAFGRTCSALDGQLPGLAATGDCEDTAMKQLTDQASPGAYYDRGTRAVVIQNLGVNDPEVVAGTALARLLGQTQAALSVAAEAAHNAA